MSELVTILRIYCSYCKKEMLEEQTYYNKLCCDGCKTEIKGFKKPKKEKKPIIANCLCSKGYRQLKRLIKCLNTHVGMPYPENPDQYYFGGRINITTCLEAEEGHYMLKIKKKRNPFIVIENDISKLSLNVINWAKTNCLNYNQLY